MNFNQKSVTIASIIIICFLLFNMATLVLNPVFASLIIFFVYYFLLYWLLDFDISPIGFINVLLISSLYIQSITMFSLTVTRNLGVFSLMTIFFVAIIFVSVQVINRIANIINVSNIKKIPLFQVSQSFNFIFTIFSLFLSILTLQILNISFPVLCVFVILIMLVLIVSNLTLVDIMDKKVLGAYSAISVIVSALFLFLVMMLNLNPIYRTVIVVSVVFILLSNYFTFIRKNRLNFFNIVQIILFLTAIIIAIELL